MIIRFPLDLLIHTVNEKNHEIIRSWILGVTPADSYLSVDHNCSYDLWIQAEVFEISQSVKRTNDIQAIRASLSFWNLKPSRSCRLTWIEQSSSKVFLIKLDCRGLIFVQARWGHQANISWFFGGICECCRMSIKIGQCRPRPLTWIARSGVDQAFF